MRAAHQSQNLYDFTVISLQHVLILHSWEKLAKHPLLALQRTCLRAIF